MSTLDLSLVRALDAVEAAAYTDLIAAAPPPVTQALGLGVSRLAGATLLHASAAPISLFNRVIGLGNEAPATEADLDAVLGRYRELGAKTVWAHLGPASRPDELRAWLAARGFSPPARNRWAKVFRGREAPPAIATLFNVRAVGPEHADALAKVIAAAHGMPPPIVPWVSALVGRAGWRAYGAFDGDALVGGGFLWQQGERAWFGLGGTLSTHRGRGAQGALLVARIRDAIASGATLLTSETGEPIADEHNPSLSNMLRCGFRVGCSRENFAPAVWP